MVSSSPFVSVVITCYNQEKFIAHAIESVMTQSFCSWECWIVDDGSTDASPAICARYADQDARIKLLLQPNTGVSSARNAGFKRSTGHYIQFLDGDDWLLPQKLEQQVAFMEAHPEYGVSYTGHQHFWQSSGNYAKYSFEVLNELPLQQLLFGYDRGVSIPIHTALIRKSLWLEEELAFPADYSHRYEDWVFWIRIALKNTRFFFLSSPMAVYRMHKANFTAEAEILATHAIQATFYISRLIPDALRSEFETGRLHFILRRYVEQKTKSERRIPFFSKTVSVIRGFRRSIVKWMAT